jgi:predicted RNase H-like HicB family nuclease
LWATAQTVEDARRELYDALDGWITVDNLASYLHQPDIGIAGGVEKVSQD